MDMVLSYTCNVPSILWKIYLHNNDWYNYTIKLLVVYQRSFSCLLANFETNKSNCCWLLIIELDITLHYITIF